MSDLTAMLIALPILVFITAGIFFGCAFRFRGWLTNKSTALAAEIFLYVVVGLALIVTMPLKSLALAIGLAYAISFLWGFFHGLAGGFYQHRRSN